MAVFYIDWTTGNDLTGTGSIGSPWKTLYKACNSVTTYGDLIHVNAGTYTETQQCVLRNGVSIEGVGLEFSIISSNYSTVNQPLIKLETTNGWLYDEGHQYISGVAFNGNLVTCNPISVNFRHYVSIHDCYFYDFLERGVVFYGCSARTYPNPYISNTTKSYYLMPDAYALGNSFIDNTVINCSRYVSGNGAGNLQVGAQDGMIIRNNVITQTGRGAMLNGYGIKFHDEGYNKNTEISGNTITVGRLGVDVVYEFAIEWWNSMGGDNIFNNRVIGAVDLVNAWDYHSVGYAVNVYDNNIGYNTAPATQERGVLLEGAMNYINVYRNYIHHVGRAIYISRQPSPQYTGHDRLFHVWIYNNLMVKLGQTGSSYQTWGVQFNVDAATDQDETQYFYIVNNVIEADSSLSTLSFSGVILPQVAEMSYIYVENNIILNFDYHAIYARFARTKATDIYIRNNLMYNNGGGNTPVYADSFPTAGVTYVSVTPADPVFYGLSDYHLGDGSPAIGAGRNVGLITDYDGVAWNVIPSIGAYEYIPDEVPTVITTVISSITTTTASGGGNVTSDGRSTVTARGVCWSIGEDPTVLDSHTIDGSGTGVFISLLSGLDPGVSYIVRAYAINSVGVGYGDQVVFTTDSPTVLPTVITSAITDNDTPTATGGGNIISDGGTTVIARGVCWSTSIDPTIALETKTSNGTGIGTFISYLTDLVSSTVYYVRAYATNSVGTAYGDNVSFRSYNTADSIPIPRSNLCNFVIIYDDEFLCVDSVLILCDSDLVSSDATLD